MITTHMEYTFDSDSSPCSRASWRAGTNASPPSSPSATQNERSRYRRDDVIAKVRIKADKLARLRGLVRVRSRDPRVILRVPNMGEAARKLLNRDSLRVLTTYPRDKADS